MSFVILHADLFTTALTDDPVIPAGDIARFDGLEGAIAEATRLRTSAADVVAQAHAQGVAAGRAEGRSMGEADVRAELLRLAQADHAARKTRQAEIAELAIAVVRRIAGELAPADVVSGLAERATAAIAPDIGATVRVHPAHVTQTRNRLAAREGVAVEADPTLTDTDCVVETALGQVHAGLEVQLAAIERVWGQAGYGN